MQIRRFVGKFSDNPVILIGSILLVIAIILSAVSLPTANRESPRHWQAVHKVKKTELNETRHVVKRYGPFLAIHQYAIGATLYASSERGVAVTGLSSFRQRAYGIGGLENMIYRKYDPQTFLSNFDPEDYKIIAQGTYTNEVQRNWGQKEYVVVVKYKSKLQEFVHVMHGTTDLFIDTRLLNAKETQELHRW